MHPNANFIKIDEKKKKKKKKITEAWRFQDKPLFKYAK